jgi:hypothetical protein
MHLPSSHAAGGSLVFSQPSNVLVLQVLQVYSSFKKTSLSFGTESLVTKSTLFQQPLSLSFGFASQVVESSLIF